MPKRDYRGRPFVPFHLTYAELMERQAADRRAAERQFKAVMFLVCAIGAWIVVGGVWSLFQG